jgi:hypothetical protein
VDSVNADTRSTVEPRIIGVMFSDALPHERRATPAPRAPDRAQCPHPEQYPRRSPSPTDPSRLSSASTGSVPIWTTSSWNVWVATCVQTTTSMSTCCPLSMISWAARRMSPSTRSPRLLWPRMHGHDVREAGSGQRERRSAGHQALEAAPCRAGFVDRDVERDLRDRGRPAAGEVSARACLSGGRESGERGRHEYRRHAQPRSQGRSLGQRRLRGPSGHGCFS